MHGLTPTGPNPSLLQCRLTPQTPCLHVYRHTAAKTTTTFDRLPCTRTYHANNDGPLHRPGPPGLLPGHGRRRTAAGAPPWGTWKWAGPARLNDSTHPPCPCMPPSRSPTHSTTGSSRRPPPPSPSSPIRRRPTAPRARRRSSVTACRTGASTCDRLVGLCLHTGSIHHPLTCQYRHHPDFRRQASH